MTHKTLIVANWKMNKTPGEAAVLVQNLTDRLESVKTRGMELVICPSFVSLRPVGSVLRFERVPIQLGAQDVYWEADGAYTGAVSARMLKDVGVEYCIVGHSERRKHFAETDATAAQKILALVKQRIRPILCVGEGLEIREKGPAAATAYVLDQIQATLRYAESLGFDWAKSGLVLAYEPIWSIGTGKTATPETAQSMATAIRKFLSVSISESFAESTQILYGGSVNALNAALFADLPDLDGCLVGGASLDDVEFSSLINTFQQAREVLQARQKKLKNLRAPALLAILDGVGLAEASPSNAVFRAQAPFLHELISDTTWPCRSLEASGLAVGLPENQMGNSEVGHLNIGAGRVVNQELTRIDLAILDGSLRANPVLTEAFAGCSQRGSRLHLIGLLSDGGVHSTYSHFVALAQMAAARGIKDIALHAILDGRDVSPDSGSKYVKTAEDFLAGLADRYPGLTAGIATVGGRYYGMDRDKRWERVERAWKTMVIPSANDVDLVEGLPASDLVDQSYKEGLYDEFMLPVALDSRGVLDGDLVVFFNFRPDRARELTRALIDPDFTGFVRPLQPVIEIICMTEYDPELSTIGAKVVFEKEIPQRVLADYFSELGLRQLHIAETEKYAHVTFFFNGGSEVEKPGEQRVLIPSPKVATYDMKPEMSAFEVTAALIEAIQTDIADVYVLNFANGDMVGHTGNQEATEQAIAVVDGCLRQIIDAVLAADGVAIVTADHGNAEQMLDDNGNVWTAHSCSPVPFAVIAKESKAGQRTVDLDRKRHAKLADIAPSLLDLMRLDIPQEFTGRSLLRRRMRPKRDPYASIDNNEVG